MVDRLKEKWGIKRNIDIILILICFSLAGSSVVLVKGYYFQLLEFTNQTPFWLKAIAYSLFIFPAYQLMLLGYGLVLGQFQFFLAKEKALLGAIGKLFGSRK